MSVNIFTAFKSADIGNGNGNVENIVDVNDNNTLMFKQFKNNQNNQYDAQLNAHSHAHAQLITPLNIQNEPLNVNQNVKINNVAQNKIKYSKQDIKARIECMSECEMIEIFRIVKLCKEKYSSNQNGVFINISNFKQKTINAIIEYIEYCNDNKTLLEKEEELRDDYKQLINTN